MSQLLLRNWLLAPLTILLATSAMVASVDGSDSLAGSQGTDTTLPATESQLTIAGRGRFAGLSVTVNQTTNLIDQAVSVTWRGGEETIQGPVRFAGNFLQIFQCWGDDDGTVPENPGPPPEQCVQGATTGVYSGIPASAVPAGTATQRVISVRDWANFDPAVGTLDERTGVVWRSFRAVDGTEIGAHVDPTFTPSRPGGNYWLNPYFSIVTTNESAASPTLANGEGAELFQVATGLQSSGLGCGQRVQRVGNDIRIPKCWLVVVPRGSPSEENVGTPFAERADNFGVVTSPVAPEAWANRIAFPLGFNPVDSPCSIASRDRRIAGNELVGPAVASWQPALCAGGERPPYSYVPVPDSSARGFIVNPIAGAPGMAVVQQPIDPALVSGDNPIVYAPLTLSGISFGFNVERIPRFDAEAGAQALAGVRVANINLTPRIVAKLLTQSYRRQLEIFEPPDYGWLPTNPAHLGDDPDFLRFNPEFSLLSIFEGRTFSGLQLPANNSDIAEQVWDWVLSDPEAAAWLAGEPDSWGMKVNPAYATEALLNPSGFPFGNPTPTSFPKADPYCYQGELVGSVEPPPLCGTDWMPYARSLSETASRTRRAFDGARIALNVAAQAPSQVWGGTTPQIVGRRSMIAITDTSSAALFGLQSARLSRAGDNRDNRVFIAPDQAGLQAGLSAMVPSDVPGVLEASPTAQVDRAYPLTALTYAAVAPLALDGDERNDYASFLEYAAGAGQVRGTASGQLPAGYEPLSSELAAQTREAAKAIRELQPPTATPQPQQPPSPPSPAPTLLPNPAGGAAPSALPSAAPASSASSALRPSQATTANPPAAVEDPIGASEASPEAVESTEVIPDEVPLQGPDERSAITTPTPSQGVGVGRVAVPVLGVTTLASALLALEMTKRPRRARSDGDQSGTGAL